VQVIGVATRLPDRKPPLGLDVYAPLTISARPDLVEAEDVHTLLAKAGEYGAYVLVGHSTGGRHHPGMDIFRDCAALASRRARRLVGKGMVFVGHLPTPLDAA
jgi:pimeloyl-ACP methyl ester carboxylesterase